MEGYQYGQKMDGDRAGKVMINSADSGISIRAVHDLFNQSQARKDKTIAISVSFLQIYNEKVFDLLNKTTLKSDKKQQQGLKIRWSKSDQFTVENLFVFRCNDAEHAI
jgi:hypothetical protein